MTEPYLPKPNQSTFTPAPAGTYPAICYRVIDIGTQEGSFQGKPKKAHKVIISWELKDEDATFVDAESGARRPMSISQTYTWSTHEKSRLRKDLESWRGLKFADSDFGEGGFSVRKLLGQPCMLGIVHTDSNGTTYANVSAISKLPKQLKDTTPQLVAETQFLWLKEGLFDDAVFQSLSDRIKEKIMSSPEYKELNRGGEYIPEVEEFHSDEIPF